MDFWTGVGIQFLNEDYGRVSRLGSGSGSDFGIRVQVSFRDRGRVEFRDRGRVEFRGRGQVSGQGFGFNRVLS